MHELGTLARQTWLVFGRSLRAGLREPALAFVFPLAFPLLIIGLFSQVYARVADLPGFPGGSYLGWMTPPWCSWRPCSAPATPPSAWSATSRPASWTAFGSCPSGRRPSCSVGSGSTWPG